MKGRFLRCALLVVASLVGSSNALAENSPPRALTEDEAVRRAISRAAVADFRSGRTGVARAVALGAGLWPNPTATYAREQVSGDPAGTDDDFAWLSQRFDLSGRRGLRRQASANRLEAVIHELDTWTLELSTETRKRFHEVLLHQERYKAAERWTERMRAITNIVARREAAGDASAYDRRRLELELARARAQARTAEAQVERSRLRLTSLLGHEFSSLGAVSGMLLPALPPPPLEELLARLPRRADFLALEKRAKAAEREEVAASRWWAPEFNVGGGVKTVDSETGRSTGFLLNFSVPLPVFDRDQDDALRAVSEGLIARAELGLQLAEAEGALQGLWVQATTLAKAAREFRRDGVVPSARLLRTARSAYESGENEILQLLDAYRSAFDAEIDVLDLESQARQTRIKLDRVAGKETP